MDQILIELKNIKQELINKIEDSKNEVKAEINQHIDKELLPIRSKLEEHEKKMDKIADETNNMNERIKNLEGNLKPTYSEVTKSPPKFPPMIQQSPVPKTKKSKIETKEKLFNEARKIVGIYPVDKDDYDRNTLEEGEKTDLVQKRTAEEFFEKELGFRYSQISELEIVRTFQSKKGFEKLKS